MMLFWLTTYNLQGLVLTGATPIAQYEVGELYITFILVALLSNLSFLSKDIIHGFSLRVKL